MQTTIELLETVKDRYGIPSDRQLSLRLKITRAQISRYRTKGEAMGEEVALRVAELLELDPGYVLASMEAERTHSKAAKAAWERAAERLNALARREASGDCILCKIADRGFPTLHPGVLMAAMGSFYRPAHA